MKLLTGILTKLNQLGAEASAVFGMGADPYRELLDQHSLEEIGAWFRQLIQSATDYIEREMNEKGNQHIAKVIDILEREYDQDLSLNCIAERLNLNPAYISRLFKQSTGEPFVNYLKQIRIDKSKSLLRQSHMKINEVGKQVGFGSSNFFIKVFKDTTGLTPGEYKKIYG
jgi:YesN/AraC family two-component response regulator